MRPMGNGAQDSQGVLEPQSRLCQLTPASELAPRRDAFGDASGRPGCQRSDVAQAETPVKVRPPGTSSELMGSRSGPIGAECEKRELNQASLPSLGYEPNPIPVPF